MKKILFDEYISYLQDYVIVYSDLDNIDPLPLTFDEWLTDINTLGYPFTDDAEKMIDFVELTKDEFLESYSYLTEYDYFVTILEYYK